MHGAESDVAEQPGEANLRSKILLGLGLLLGVAGIAGLIGSELYWRSIGPLRVVPDTLAQGTGHVCAVEQNGPVVCWGTAAFNVLDSQDRTFATNGPVAIDLAAQAVDVAATPTASCAVLDTGGVSCWGGLGWFAPGTFGTLDLIDSEHSFKEDIGLSHPVAVTGISDAVEIEGGTFGMCVRHGSGTVSCLSDKRRDRSVPGLDDAIGLSVGSSHACALRSDATAVCWGSNGEGELGVAAGDEPDGPQQIEGDNLAVIAAGSEVTCSIDRDGQLRCWGRNYGSAPVQVAPDGFRDVAEIGGGVCGVHADGWVACGFDRPLKRSDDTFFAVKEAIAIANNGSGSFNHCVEKRDARVACWSDNDAGIFRVGTSTPQLIKARFIPNQIRTLWRTAALFGVSAGGFLLLVRRKRNQLAGT